MVDFLTLDDIIEIHKDQIDRYGGSPGIRDVGLLQSAAAVPSSTFESDYLHRDIFLMAAAYLFHVTQNHPFVDGNKRTGAVAALVFLEINGILVNAPENDLEHLVRKVATGHMDKEGIAIFLKSHSQSERDDHEEDL